VPAPHGFAVRFSAVRLRFLVPLTGDVRPAAQFRADAESVHRIPPHVRDDRERPSGGRDGVVYNPRILICPAAERGKFGERPKQVAERLISPRCRRVGPCEMGAIIWALL
jgi:hypothetical protein